jgi:uncharacterized protein (DUF2235 family)
MRGLGRTIVTKKLIVCADGTWSNPSQKDREQYRPSNVVKIISSLAHNDSQGNAQIICYEPGIAAEGILDPWVSGFTGAGLSRSVKAAYTFLINNYEPGDLVYCFGFSRGAFVVRSLCGLVGKAGLLKKHKVFLCGEAYDLYRRTDIEAESPETQRFRKGNVHLDPIDDIRNPFIIHFMGVWDTVGALGIPIARMANWTSSGFAFHDTTLNPYLPYAYQALAVDERREAYSPTVWKRHPSANNKDVQQIWFCGSHSNVGGGYEDMGLANIAFIWMLEKAQSCGLLFDKEYVYNTYYKEQNHLGELRDPVVGVYKWLPKRYRTIGALNEDGSTVITGEGIHESVLLRRKALGDEYAPLNLPEDIDKRIPVVPYGPPN